jgi:hypothetical protein
MIVEQGARRAFRHFDYSLDLRLLIAGTKYRCDSRGG